MYDPILSQVIYDANEYQKRINYIERAKKDLPNWKGKPKYNVIFESVDIWEREVYKIKKTIIPAMKELIEKIERDEHLKEALLINGDLIRDYSNGL